jgi:hypothetical protein
MRLAALGILALAGPCFGASPQGNPYQDAHLRNLYVERRLALEKAWAKAGEEDRERVRASARANKTGGQPALYAASAQILTDARFMLAGDEKSVSELSIQSRVACSLDLMVLPGAFGAVDRDRGDALIVRVLPAYTRLYQRALPEQIQLTMIWVGPDGKETRARSEPVHRSAFVLPGFEMYFHAPPSKPGTWSLIPEVEWDGVKGRGVPVPIEGVRALFDRYDRLVSQAGSGESQRAILASLERILLHGGRDAGDLSVEKMLEGEAPARAHRSVHSWAGKGACYQLDPEEGTPAKGVTVVVSPVLHEAGWALVGDEGRGWRELATASAQRVLLTELSPSHSSGPDVFDLLARLRREHPDLPLTLVLHGSGLGRLQLSLMRSNGPPPFDRLVVDSVLWGAPVRPLVDVPMLSVCPLEEKAMGLQRSSVSVSHATPPPSLYEVRSIDLPVITGARLPGWIGQWLELLD